LPIGCKTTISGSVGISLDASSDVGLEYNLGKWNIINNCNINFDSPSLDFSLGGLIKQYAGPQLNAQFYGLEDAFNAYASFLPFVEGEFDLLSSPLWKIWVGFGGNVGIKTSWFKLQKDQTLIEYRHLLKQAEDLIISAIPPEAKIGDTITINGSNFGYSRATSYVGFTNGHSLSNIDSATVYPKWTDGEIQVKIPGGLTAGKVKLFINIGGFLSNMVDFTIIESPSPQISDINPSPSKIGDTITISGSNFGNSQGLSFVSFNNVKAAASDYQSWSDTQIKVKVPLGATSGKVSVIVNGIKSNEKDIIINTQPNQITIPASRDAYTEESNGSINYNAVNLKFGYQSNPSINLYHPCLYFDIPNDINSSDILSAKLYLTKSSGSGTQQVASWRYLKNSWGETTINGNWLNSDNVDMNSFHSFGPVTGDVTIDLIDAVKKWIANPSSNFGIILLCDGTNPITVFTFYDSENGNENQKPRLVITLK
jgi:hypothetical protein